MLVCTFVSAGFEVSTVVVVKDEQFKPRDAWDAPIREIPLIEGKEIPDVLQGVLMFAASVRSGWDGLDSDNSGSSSGSVFEAARDVDAWNYCAGVEGVGLGAFVMHGVFAGVHHCNDK